VCCYAVHLFFFFNGRNKYISRLNRIYFFYLQESRSQRQSANSSKYRANIFENSSGKFYVSTSCHSHKELKNLVLETGGELTSFKNCAKFIITEVYPKRKLKENAFCLRPSWICDCIVENTFKNTEDRKYVIKL
jgi:hypothetical protein